jgi:hypothetical protein
MTIADTIKYYADLLILQYKGKPKAYATIEALASFAVMDLLPVDVRDAYDLDSAQGVQLDVLGKYQGVTRSGNTFQGPYSLSDTEFRTLIRIAIVLNASDGTLYSIKNLLNTYFPGVILLFDHEQMRISYSLQRAFSRSLWAFRLVLLFIQITSPHFSALEPTITQGIIFHQ